MAPRDEPDSFMMHLSTSVPIDVNYIAYMIMFYQGMGNLFPWNAFINASGYFGQRFCGSPFAENFENYFSFSFTISQTIGLIISVVYQNKISTRNKIIWPLFFYSGIFLLTTILVGFEMEANTLFAITLISTVLAGISGAILSAGLFGLGAMFPSSYTGALMNGQGLAGLVVALAGIITTVAVAPIDTCGDATDDSTCDQSTNYSALAYFLIATMILLSCVGAYLILGRLKFTQYYEARGKLGEINSESADYNNPLLSVVTGGGGGGGGADERGSGGTKTEIIVAHRDSDEEPKEALSFKKIMSVLQLIRTPAFSVWFVFTVTIGIFPALTVLLESTQKCKSGERFFNDLFTPFFFLLFNLFDLIGRLVAGGTKPIFTDKNVWMASVARVVFFPLFLLCNVSDSKLPVVFTNDAWPIIFMMLFAFSNGYVASTCMMLGPTAVSVKDAAVSGTIMVLSLTLGLFSGACVSFLTVFISQGGDSF